MKCNQSRLGFELVLPCPFPTTITITPRAPPYITIYMHIDIWKEIMEKNPTVWRKIEKQSNPKVMNLLSKKVNTIVDLSTLGVTIFKVLMMVY